MNQLIFSALVSIWAPTAPILGIPFIILFELVVIMAGLDYDGMNKPTLGRSQSNDKAKCLLELQ